jgi:hypothetical protein
MRDSIVPLDSPDIQHSFARLPTPLRARLAAAPPQGMIRSEDIADCLAELGWEIERLMMALLPLAATHAQAPVSNFSVGAVALECRPQPAIAARATFISARTWNFPAPRCPSPFTPSNRQRTTRGSTERPEFGFSP